MTYGYETTYALLVPSEGASPVPGGFPLKSSVKESVNVLLDGGLMLCKHVSSAFRLQISRGVAEMSDPCSRFVVVCCGLLWFTTFNYFIVGDAYMRR